MLRQDVGQEEEWWGIAKDLYRRRQLIAVGRSIDVSKCCGREEGGRKRREKND